ncbi:hypothetical protein GCM10009554_11090 [Kribbella koreensis]|uniref:Uncharacterized protein n=2 Tax=Kribbella koreensis TaxID=57909 RepID=A0ABN1PKM3_9ACTN
MMDDPQTWREARREAAAAQAAALQHRKDNETAQARKLLAEFVATMHSRGIEPQPLRAPVVGTGASYRTDVTGWYLRRNQSLGVDAEGNFYILGMQPSVKARLLGVRVVPSDPPIIIGQGARDGESLPLKQLLELRLAEIEG